MCTNTSREPSLGVMNPKPFWVLKNFTVPVAMVIFLALTLLEVEMRMILCSCDRNIRVLGGGLIGAHSGSAARQNRKPSFNERWIRSLARNVHCYAAAVNIKCWPD